MSYWVHTGSDAHGGEIFGDYDTVDDAAQAIARMAIAAFQLNDGVFRTYGIVKARTKDAAIKSVNKRARE